MPSNIGMGGQAIARGDFNSDGIHDLAVTGSSSTSVLLGNGNGTFKPAVNFATPSGSSIVVGELSGDGLPDLAVAGARTFFQVSFNTLSVLINNSR
jgi:FG-GAP-like repeat